jgi:hypothetical protein
MRTLRAVGIVLVLLSGLGFLTVADDLRHVGELVGVSAVGIVGAVVGVGAHLALRKRKHSIPSQP